MSDLRVWKLNTDQPLATQIAADARLVTTDPADDQTWDAMRGVGESAALALQTHYGGRVGLVSFVPMWSIDGAVLYQAQQYAAPVTMRGIAPAFLQYETRLTPQIALLAEFWAMESHAVGGRFLLRSLSKTPLTLRLDLLVFIGVGGTERTPRPVPLPGELHALALGNVGDLVPMLVMENGYVIPNSGNNKLSANISLAVGGRAAVRFVCASLPDPRESLSLARRWQTADWGKAFKKLSVAANAAPRIETGDTALDATLASGYQQLVQSLIHAPARATHPVLVPSRGQFDQRWSYVNSVTAYDRALALAAVDPTLAQGIVRNALATQREEGWVDGTPRIGDRPTYLHPPLLARLAWSLFQYSEDAAFLREAFPPLFRFFQRWLDADHDVDGDGAAEWQSAEQAGFSSLSLGIDRIESPVLTAFLLSEAISLREIAHYLRDEGRTGEMQVQIDRLQTVLASFREDGRYRLRDRDTHTRSTAQTLLRDGAGDEDHILAYELTPPARIVVEVEGGWQHTPRFTLHLEGVGRDGQPARESASSSAFAWQTGRGYYVSNAVFARLDRLHCDGLVRVYRVHAATPDQTTEGIEELLPLWAIHIPPEDARMIADSATQADWLQHGAPFVTLMGEGLLESGHSAVALVQAALHQQGERLLKTRSFGQELPPLHLLLRVLGVRVVSPTKMWTGGAFDWGQPVKITHKGVVVERSAEGTRIAFPSGHVVTLAADAPFQEVVDLPPKAGHNPSS
jgi:hypothetical protein